MVNGIVYVGSEDGYLYAITASTGHLAWSYKTGGGILSSPTVSGANVYVGSDNGSVYAINTAFHNATWTFATG